MHIIAFILLFIIGSIQAASHGDWSGVEAIGMFILYIALFFIFAFIILNPALLVIAIIAIVLIAICTK